MLKELCLIVCASVTLVLTSADPCDRNGVNGCSIPGNLPFFYKERFNWACNRHDVCYRCGDYKHVSRKDCDVYFYSNMKKKCKRKFYCKHFARVYYLGVRYKGGSHYRKTSPSWCNQNWVSGCMK